MTNNIARIRAALELLEWRVLEAERKNQPIVATRRQLDEALAALAELEKAAPQFVAGEVTDEVAARTFSHWADAPFRVNSRDDDITMPMLGRVLIAAVRSELGPALGLVEIREPTPEECERISMAYYDDEALVDRDHRHLGRGMFNACRAVMWPKSEAK